MFVTIINDCKDANAFGRQGTRAAALFGGPVTTVGIANDIEAAGNLVDALDAAEGRAGAILVNVAPRSGAAKRWTNGTPFGWLRVGETVVVASIDGLTLSLVKKLGVAAVINVFDIPEVMDAAARHSLLPRATADAVAATQFRSFEFLPRVARWLSQGYVLPSTPLAVADVPDAPPSVWWTDNFGNCKTTVLPEELPRLIGDGNLGGVTSLAHYARLKDVPDGEAAFVTGSSGFGDKRFVEVVIQGGNAAARFGLKSGRLLDGRRTGAVPSPLPAVVELA